MGHPSAPAAKTVAPKTEGLKTVVPKTVTLKLNQQQLELIDRTIARGVAPDREALIRLALREYAAARADGKPLP